jgi:hypothetical protein
MFTGGTEMTRTEASTWQKSVTEEFRRKSLKMSMATEPINAQPINDL